MTGHVGKEVYATRTRLSVNQENGVLIGLRQRSEVVQGPCIAKRQQDCSLPATVVGRSATGLLRVSACSGAVLKSVVSEQSVRALFQSSQ